MSQPRRIPTGHPLFLGPSNTPLRGVWVRCLRTNNYAYVAHVERPRNRDDSEDRRANEARLWLVYPPDPARKVKTWTAGFAFPEEVKKIPRWGNYFEEEE